MGLLAAVGLRATMCSRCASSHPPLSHHSPTTLPPSSPAHPLITRLITLPPLTHSSLGSCSLSLWLKGTHFEERRALAVEELAEATADRLHHRLESGLRRELVRDIEERPRTVEILRAHGAAAWVTDAAVGTDWMSPV